MNPTAFASPWRARFLSALLAALVALSLGGAAIAAGGSGVVNATGRIGPLQIDKSTRADVIAFAGAPDREIKERVLGFPHYDALGYDCSDTQGPDNFTLGNDGPYCSTIFFLDISTKKLEDFFTTSASYREAHGVRIGTSVSVAQRLLHNTVNRSCLVVLRANSNKAVLRINFTGGRADAFAVHSRLRTSGLFHCMA